MPSLSTSTSAILTPSSLFPLPSTLSLLTPRRLASTALVCLLAVLMLGADASQDPAARFGRVGHNLMCICGCAQVLVECNHVGCPDSERMIGELRTQIAGPGAPASPGSGGLGAGGSGGLTARGPGTLLAAASDADILKWFAAKYGGTALAAPLRGGFDNVAWAIPIAMFLFGTLGAAYLVKLWTARRNRTLADLPSSHLTIDESLRDRIRRETEY